MNPTEGKLTEARWIYLNQVACEARQGHEQHIALGVGEVIQLTNAALESLKAPAVTTGERPQDKMRTFNIGAKETPDLNAACCVHLEEFLDEMGVEKASAVTVQITVHTLSAPAPLSSERSANENPCRD